MNNQLIFNYDLSRITDVLQNKCSKRAFISIVKTAILSEKTAILCRFSVKIRIFANQNLSLTKRSTEKRVLSSDTTLYNKVEFTRLMNMNQTRAKARTFTIDVCNCIIINRLAIMQD